MFRAVALVVLGLVALVVGVLRSDRFAHFVAERLARLVREQTGLSFAYAHVGVSLLHHAVRLEGIELRHPTEGRFVRVDTIDVVPSLGLLLGRTGALGTLVIDGGRIDLVVRNGRLVNGPIVRESHDTRPRTTPHPTNLAGDISISDIALHIDHDVFGTLDLPAIDLDAHAAPRVVDDGRVHEVVLVGLLARGARIEGPLAACLGPRADRIEARAEYVADRRVRIGLARARVGDLALRLDDALLPLVPHAQGHLDVEADADLDVLHCLVPTAPMLHGRVTVGIAGDVDGDALNALVAGHVPTELPHFRANGFVRARDVGLEVRIPEWTFAQHGQPVPMRPFTYSFGDAVELRFDVDPERVRVTSLSAEHSGGTVTLRDPHEPLVMTLDAHPTVTGRIHLEGIRLEHLLKDIAVTDFAKPIWTIDADATMRGELWRFAEPDDPRHPALAFDLVANTQNFAVLREYHQFLPQFPMIGIRDTHLTGRITVDGRFVRFMDLDASFGLGHRSRVHVDLVRLCTDSSPRRVPGSTRTASCYVSKQEDLSPTGMQFMLRGGRATDVNLADIGQVAGFPITGMAAFTTDGGGPFPDPVLGGEAHLREFTYNGLPLGDIDTPVGAQWRYRNLRVDADRLSIRAGDLAHPRRSDFDVDTAFLDFGIWTLHAGAHIRSGNFHVDDFYHMFKFENDPTFSAFSGETMPVCNGDSPVEHGVPCVANDGGAARAHSGTLDAHVDYALGRAGDDPGGVMEVEGRVHDMNLHGFGETISHLDTPFRYVWLQRDRGARGARLQLDHASGELAGGSVEASGNMDLGGAVHFVAAINGARLERTARLAGTGVTGGFAGSGSLEGTPELQQWTIDGLLTDLTAAQRNVGDVAFRVRGSPERNGARDETVRASASHPSRGRWAYEVDALDGVLAARGSLLVPWRTTSWTDADGRAQPDVQRDFSHAELTGRIETTQAVDALPWLPASLAGRLGEHASARARVRLDLDRVMLADAAHGDARLTVDTLALRAAGIPLTLAPGAVLGVCAHDGRVWIEPAAATSREACVNARADTSDPRTDPTRAARLDGPDGTHFEIAGGATVDGAVGASLRGSFDLARLASLLPGVTQATGVGTFGLDVDGTRSAPRLTGAITLDHATLLAPVLPSPVEDVSVHARFDGARVVLDVARARFGQSPIDLSGGVMELDGLTPSHLRVPVNVADLQLVPQPGIEVGLSARGEIRWDRGGGLPHVLGDVSLGRVRYTRPVNLSTDLSGNVRLAGGSGGEDTYDPAGDRLALDLHVHTREPIRVANNLAEAEITIAPGLDFHVIGTNQRPVVQGALDVSRGRVFFRGSEFDIVRGQIRFENEERIVPAFDVVARTDIRRNSDTSRDRWVITLHAHGTPDDFALDTTSDPNLSREDIALLLTLRMTRAEFDQVARTAASGVNSGGLLALEAASSAIASATGFDRTVRQGTLLVDEFRLGSAYSPAAGRTVPQVVVGRRISDGVRIGAVVNAAPESHTEMRATVDLRINQNTSVQVGYDNMTSGTAAGNSGFVSQTLGGANIGADLRWRLEFE